jgi:hypothetical protein
MRWGDASLEVLAGEDRFPGSASPARGGIAVAEDQFAQDVPSKLHGLAPVERGPVDASRRSPLGGNADETVEGYSIAVKSSGLGDAKGDSYQPEAPARGSIAPARTHSLAHRVVSQGNPTSNRSGRTRHRPVVSARWALNAPEEHASRVPPAGSSGKTGYLAFSSRVRGEDSQDGPPFDLTLGYTRSPARRARAKRSEILPEEGVQDLPSWDDASGSSRRMHQRTALRRSR